MMLAARDARTMSLAFIRSQPALSVRRGNPELIDACGNPVGKWRPLIVDMAPSLAWGKIYKALQGGEKSPGDWALVKHGQGTGECHGADEWTQSLRYRHCRLRPWVRRTRYELRGPHTVAIKPALFMSIANSYRADRLPVQACRWGRSGVWYRPCLLLRRSRGPRYGEAPEGRDTAYGRRQP
ncbi:hypothetical protein C7974DRAFT_24359 [Boeremia exigua]|uniref:uncharacterized protein n=1 Tax=Boeremia exigua TaxID=749465 RepID=UPI001E8DED90|nr:uncharacterized protein C7974DRAFT_24359 [Boeremia exigua]KAH6644602.1 hypothetical protein C7974DRAFT_24359 [Boeremia exigua]